MDACAARSIATATCSRCRDADRNLFGGAPRRVAERAVRHAVLLACGTEHASCPGMTRRVAMKSLVLCCICVGFVPPALADNSPEHSADVTITGHIFQPPELPPPPLSQLHLPDGFTIERYVENLGNPRML